MFPKKRKALIGSCIQTLFGKTAKSSLSYAQNTNPEDGQCIPHFRKILRNWKPILKANPSMRRHLILLQRELLKRLLQGLARRPQLDLLSQLGQLIPYFLRRIGLHERLQHLPRSLQQGLRHLTSWEIWATLLHRSLPPGHRTARPQPFQVIGPQLPLHLPRHSSRHWRLLLKLRHRRNLLSQLLGEQVSSTWISRRPRRLPPHKSRKRAQMTSCPCFPTHLRLLHIPNR